MHRQLLRFLFLLAVALVAHGASEAHGHHEHMAERMKQWHHEQAHYNKIHSDDVDDWSLHDDVDDTQYWFSRTLRRSQKEPPKGWVKQNGKWKAPPRKRDEL